MNRSVCFVGVGNIGSALFNSCMITNHNFQKNVCDLKEYQTGKWKQILKDNFLESVFICVPVNNLEDSQDLTILNIYLEELYNNNFSGLVFICSTVFAQNIETKYREKLNLVLFPQFMDERKAITQFKESKYLVLGADTIKVSEAAEKYILFRFEFKYVPKITKTSMEIASYFKYLRNFKMSYNVSFWNYVFEFSKEHNFDYRIIKEMLYNIPVSDCDMVCADGYYGFGGTCLPKDIEALDNLYEHSLTKTIKEYNNKIRNQ